MKAGGSGHQLLLISCSIKFSRQMIGSAGSVREGRLGGMGQGDRQGV